MSPALTRHEFTLSQFAVTITIDKHGDEIGLIDAAMRVGFYASIIAIFLLIIALIVKLLWNSDDDEAGERNPIATETSRLLLSEEKDVFSLYGTSEEDLESAGKGSCCDSSTSISSDDLYDEKICAICYDDQRSCLFIPCGHCVTCFTCAKRIIKTEMKNCPMCRTIIHKVRKLRIV